MAFFWMLILIFALTAYVVLDGYDLGIGVLTLFQRDGKESRRMLEVVGNVWDGNESWLVLLAMGLWGGMPDAYATALPGLYLPLIVMIVGLIFRGFAIEMALHRPGFDRLWGTYFGIGSLAAAFAQGVLFGGLVTGITVRDGMFAGATWDFFGHGYSVLTGILTVVLFSLAGAARLQGKVDGELRGWVSAIVRKLTLLTVPGVALAAALLPIASSAHLHIGGAARSLTFAYAVLLAVAGFVTVYWRAGRTPDVAPFLGVVTAEVAGMIGLLALYFPQLVPPAVTVYSAASSHETLLFLSVIIGIFGPATVAYHAYANWVFRGRQELHDSENAGVVT